MEGKIVKGQNVSIVIKLKKQWRQAIDVARYNKFVNLVLESMPVANCCKTYTLILILIMTSHPNENDFNITLPVLESDIDEMSHVNNVVYVRWVQEVAAAHWATLASAEARQMYLWVVLRHEIDYVSAALRGDTIVATTWVGESNGPRSERFVYLTNKSTGKLLAKAKTIWCLLDGETMKPKRVDESVMALLKPNNA